MTIIVLGSVVTADINNYLFLLPSCIPSAFSKHFNRCFPVSLSGGVIQSFILEGSGL